MASVEQREDPRSLAKLIQNGDVQRVQYADEYIASTPEEQISALILAEDRRREIVAGQNDLSGKISDRLTEIDLVRQGLQAVEAIIKNTGISVQEKRLRIEEAIESLRRKQISTA